MQLTLDNATGKFQITGYEPGCVFVNKSPYHRSIVLTPDILITDWPPQQSSQLTSEHLQDLIKDNPEIILIGTGNSYHDIPIKLLAICYEKQLGIEVMTTPSACKTFTLLAADRRRVIAALFVGN